MPGPEPSSQNPIDKYFVNVTRYHYFFFSLYLLSKFTTVWHTLNIVFISPPMNYTCADTPANASSGEDMLNKCPCENPVWDTSMFTKTVQTTYKILCSEKYLISISESGTFFGVLWGSMLFGLLSDRYGRLITFSGSMFMMFVTGCLAGIMPNIFLFIIARIFEGAGVGGTLVTGFVLAMEFCGPKYRAIISSLIHIPANLGLVLLAGISYLIRDYQIFQFAISIPLLFLSTVKFCILESPKWLLEHNKEKTLKVMQKFCRFNKNPCETLRGEIESYQGSQSTGVKLKFYHIFKYKRHTRNFLCMAYCFFVCGMCYYGVAQFIGKMSTYVHVNTALNGLFCCVGTCFSIVTINRFSRKRFLGACMTIAGICMFVVVSIPPAFKHSFISVFCACISSCSFYVAFIITYLYGIELFPTSIRNSVFGMLSLSSRIGQIMGPQINALSSTVAGVVFGIAAIIAAGLTFLLPETKGVELPSNLEDDPSVRPVQTNPEAPTTRK